MATAQLNRARAVKKLEKPRPLKLNQRNSTVDGRITTGKKTVYSHFSIYKLCEILTHFLNNISDN